jgi:hypothetical protein
MIPQKNLTHVCFHVAKERYGVGEDKFGPAPSLAPRIGALEAMQPFRVAQELDFAPDQLRTPDGIELEPWVKCPVRPLVDEPLVTASVRRLPDGRLILAGSDGGLRIRLWESGDGAAWSPLCTALDLGDPDTCRWPHRAANAWTRFAGCVDGKEPGRGIVSLRFYHLRDICWIVFAVQGVGAGLLKSVSGSPEGPYRTVAELKGPETPARLLTRANSVGLFEDTDGSIHVTWDEGWIARLRDDLAGLTEAPRFLVVEPESPLGDYPLFCGRSGAAVFRVEGRYALVATDVNPRLGGNPCRDAFIAFSDTLHGPYGQRRLLVPHGNGADLFQDGAGRWFATCTPHAEDRFALCQERATIVPLSYDRGMNLLYRRLWTVTEAGPIGRLKPAIDVSNGRPIEIRDPQALVASDGWTYVAGTHRKTTDGVAGIRLWRSRDFTNWEPVRGAGDRGDFVWLATESAWATQVAPHEGLDAPDCRQWGAQLFEHNGTCYIPFMIWPLNQTGILRSVSGSPEGPYVETGFRFKDGAPHLFRDDDGQVWIYFCFGPTRLAPLNADLSGFAGPLADVTYQDDRQQGYEGTWILKLENKYLLFQSDWWGENKLQRNAANGVCCYGYPRYGTYDWMVSVADNIRGPYGPPRLAVPHGGTCSVVRAPDGRWMASVFGGDSTGPFACSLAFVPLEIREKDGTLLVSVRP